MLSALRTILKEDFKKENDNIDLFRYASILIILFKRNLNHYWGFIIILMMSSFKNLPLQLIIYSWPIFSIIHDSLFHLSNIRLVSYTCSTYNPVVQVKDQFLHISSSQCSCHLDEMKGSPIPFFWSFQNQRVY